MDNKDINLSRSSISIFVRLQRKVRSQNNEMLLPRIVEIEQFLKVVTLKRLENCKHKGWSPHHKFSQKRILDPPPATKRVCRKNVEQMCNGLPRAMI